MSVSEKDKKYFERIGAAKAESHAEATREHLARTLDERLARSWEIYLANRDVARDLERVDDPSPFYERARKLGLYRP